LAEAQNRSNTTLWPLPTLIYNQRLLRVPVSCLTKICYQNSIRPCYDPSSESFYFGPVWTPSLCSTESVGYQFYSTQNFAFCILYQHDYTGYSIILS